MRRSTLPALLAICCALGLVLSAGVIVAQTPPGAPTVDTATPGTSSISIAWTAPSDIGSAAIVAYDLRYIRSDASDKSDSKWTEKQDIWSSGSLTYTITGLRRDTSFDIQVRAVNSGTSNTDGPWSNHERIVHHRSWWQPLGGDDAVAGLLAGGQHRPRGRRGLFQDCAEFAHRPLGLYQRSARHHR